VGAKVFVDLEFTNLPWSGHSEPLWVGLARDDGNSFSAINADVTLEHASQFVLDVIVPKMGDAEPRLSSDALAEAVRAFCRDVSEFWAWCPSRDELVAVFGMDVQTAATLWADVWDWDLQLLRRLVQPWPDEWPTTLNDLNARARAAHIDLPANPIAHHPRSDAEWGRRVFEMSE
jgi:hypothetical protein